MAKNFFLMALTILFISAFEHQTFANYPTYLNGDRNFILCDGKMGTAWYVDRSSLNVHRYNPPNYIIAVNVVSASSAIGSEEDFYTRGGRGKIDSVKTYRFYYNSNDIKMYVENKPNDWVYLNPDGSWADTGIRMPAGEIAFALAYNKKFYGNLTRRSYDGKIYNIYSDDFYNRI